MKRLLLAVLVLGVLSGCSSLARGGAAGAAAPDEEDEENLGPIPMMGGAAPAAGPGTMEVAWEDNGVPIRQLTGDGKPYEMKVPDSKIAKKRLSPKSAR